jgi:3-isopropylmalate/(R)-2-methylmalate dehydratase small subunit
MSAEPFVSVSSTALVLPVDDIDTDQIIPARFLKVTEKKGLGERLFADWRGSPDFPLDREGAKASKILVAGINFGCGSSREHAPWALADWGFKVVIARSFGDIFKENATKNGLLVVALEEAAHAKVLATLRADPGTVLAVDLSSQTVKLPAGDSFSFSIDAFAKHCLLNGIDELGYILSFKEKIEEYERRAPR